MAVNLRKAFLTGLVNDSATEADRYHPVDSFVHQFCKLFSRHGAPEYGCGVHFVDFLSIQASDCALGDDSCAYF